MRPYCINKPNDLYLMQLSTLQCEMSLATAHCTKDVACTAPENDSDPTSSPPPKKSKLDSSPEREKCMIYIVDKRISSGHLAHLKGVAQKKGFNIATSVR